MAGALVPIVCTMSPGTWRGTGHPKDSRAKLTSAKEAGLATRHRGLATILSDRDWRGREGAIGLFLSSQD